jgi:alkanesulfonate monooxygenase
MHTITPIPDAPLVDEQTDDPSSSPVFHWFLPTSGDGREVVYGARSGLSGAPLREPTLDYLRQVACAADQFGFSGVLTPTGTWCHDAWVVTSALMPETRSLRYLVAMRPGFTSPTLTAQMAATFQHMSGGRLALNLVAGGDTADQQCYGDWLDHDQRYARADEFLTVLRGAWAAEGFDHAGKHYRVRDASVMIPPDSPPAIYFGGASAPAEEVAARHADVYMAWGETTEMLAERVERMRRLASRHERRLRFGLRLHVISRNTAAEAWAETDRILDQVDEATVRFTQRQLKRVDSVGQQRQNALHKGSREHLVIEPNLWAGLGLIKGAGSTALVGSHAEVAARIRDYQEIGFDEFVFSGYPHLEEAYQFGEGVLPLFRVTDNAPEAQAMSSTA